MGRYSDNLGLELPFERENFNINTWNANMRKLDEAYALLKNGGETRPISADLVQYDNTNSGLAATNLQLAMDEIASENIDTDIYEIEVTEDMTINIATYAHIYIVLKFGDTVHNITWTKSLPGKDFHWEGGQPTFQANSTYELSFLYLDCCWFKRE